MLNELDKEILKAKSEAEKAFVRAIEIVNDIDDKLQKLEIALSTTHAEFSHQRDACKKLARDVRVSLNAIQNTSSDCD